MERLSHFSDDNDDNDDDDDDDDEDEKNQASWEHLEKRREELVARMRQSIIEENKEGEGEDEEDERGDDKLDLRHILIECFERGLRDKTDEEKYIIDLGGESKFEFKFVNNNCALKISDGGKTLSQITQTKRKVKNILKGFVNIEIEGEEISITIEDPSTTLMALLTLYSAIDAVKKIK